MITIIYINPKLFSVTKVNQSLITVSNIIPKIFSVKQIKYIDYWNPLKPLGGESVNFWVKGRSGLTMPDTIGADDVSVLTPTFLCSGGDYCYGDKTRSQERVFDGGSYTIYFKSKQVTTTTDNTYIFDMGANWAGRGIALTTSNAGTRLYWLAYDGTHSNEAMLVNGIEATIKPLDWFEVLIQIDFIAKTLNIKLYNSVGVIVLQNNVSIAAWTFNTDNNSTSLKFSSVFFAIADFKKFSAIKTLSQCQDNSYVTDLQIWHPELVSGTDVSGNALHLTNVLARINKAKYYSNKSTYLLDYGYSIYSKALEPDIYVPNSISGTAIVRSFSGYAKVRDVTGDLTSHNLADSKLLFSGGSSANWDKSDATLFSSIKSLNHWLTGDYFSYYNASNPKQWHITEINKITMNLFYNTNYKGLTFAKITNNSINDRNALTELFGFDTNKTGNNLTSALTYCSDNKIISDAVICTIAVSGAPRTRTMYLKGITGMPPTMINWGDGCVDTLVMDGTSKTMSHVYYADGTFTVQLQGVSSLSSIAMNDYPWTGSATQFENAINLEVINITNTGFINGDISGWSSKMREIWITDTDMGEGTSEVTGSMDHMKDIEKLFVYGKNTIYGSITDKVKLTNVYLAGANKMTGDASNCVDMVQFESSMFGNPPLITANITNWSKIRTICSHFLLTGVVTNLTTLRYLSSIGDTELTGDISGLVNLYLLALNQTLSHFTGSIVNLIKLETFQISGTGVTKPTRLNLHTQICAFYVCSDWVYSSAEINQLLADIKANKDVDRTNEDGVTITTRVINLESAGSETPSGQGLTDKTYLEAYRSPGNSGSYALWTINTWMPA
jgi:hypothetical protein